MKLCITLTMVILLAVSCGQSQEKISTTASLISDVHIIDVRNGNTIESQQVVVDSGRIVLIAAKVDRENYHQIIDGSNKYLIPGLAEMHAHIPSPSTSKERIEDVLFLYLSNGITTIRGMLGHPSHLELRSRAEQGALISPRIFTSSPSLNGNTVPTPSDAVDKVIAYSQDGYDFLKIHPGISLEAFDALVTTANVKNIRFSGHVPVDVGIRHALASKYASIDHIDGFLEGLVPDSANVIASENGFFGYNFTPLADRTKMDELIAFAKENKVWIVPTQSLFTRWFAPISADELLKQPEMQYMPATTLTNWKTRKEQSTSKAGGFSIAQWEVFISIRKELLKKLQDGGHGILLGSDAPQLFNVPGFSIHHEMKAMEDAGLNALQILQSGTVNPAIFFGKETLFGEIKVGLDADLVLLNSNPLDNINALKEIEGVMVRGQWLDKETISNRLQKISDNASQN